MGCQILPCVTTASGIKPSHWLISGTTKLATNIAVFAMRRILTAGLMPPGPMAML